MATKGNLLINSTFGTEHNLTEDNLITAGIEADDAIEKDILLNLRKSFTYWNLDYEDLFDAGYELFERPDGTTEYRRVRRWPYRRAVEAGLDPEANSILTLPDTQLLMALFGKMAFG